MELLNVIEIENNVVVTISSYDTTAKNRQDAEGVFKGILLTMNPYMTPDEIDDAIENGYYVSPWKNHSVCLTWSTIID